MLKVYQGKQRENSDVPRKAFSNSVFRFVGSEVFVVCRHCASFAHRQCPAPAHKGQGQPLAEIYGSSVPWQESRGK